MQKLGLAFFVIVGLALGGCTSGQASGPELPHWAFEREMVIPADESLARAEDGVVVTGGRLIVADQLHGLRLLAPDGTSRPFGRFAAAGYLHDPPVEPGGPNGVSLEPGGKHILVADVFRGGIYRVDVETEETELLYQHRFGVNTAVRDRIGGVWFTQSTRNGPVNGEEELFNAVAVPTPDGALFYLPPPHAAPEATAWPVAGDLLFANGIVLDETRGTLYVAETMGNRIQAYEFDSSSGTVTGPVRTIGIDHPDNLERDEHGRIWIACPIRSEVVVFDPATGAVESVFRVSTPESEHLLAQIDERTEAGATWLDLMGPALWAPAPGMVTGVILSGDGEPVYATGLGNAIIRLPRE